MPGWLWCRSIWPWCWLMPWRRGTRSPMLFQVARRIRVRPADASCRVVLEGGISGSLCCSTEWWSSPFTFIQEFKLSLSDIVRVKVEFLSFGHVFLFSSIPSQSLLVRGKRLCSIIARVTVATRLASAIGRWERMERRLLFRAS